jgi:hypothetical protein
LEPLESGLTVSGSSDAAPTVNELTAIAADKTRPNRIIASFPACARHWPAVFTRARFLPADPSLAQPDSALRISSLPLGQAADIEEQVNVRIRGLTASAFV